MLGKNDKGKVKHRMQALFIYYKSRYIRAPENLEN